MKKVDFEKAYYIKLGKGGMYERSSISESKLRIGWVQQNVQDINDGNWEKILEQLNKSHSVKGVATRDLNALRLICESTSKDLWITFSQGTMWWCRLGSRQIFQDKKSKYRLVKGKWSNQDVRGSVLEINSIPGVLAKIQRFQGTVCNVWELETLKR